MGVGLWEFASNSKVDSLLAKCVFMLYKYIYFSSKRMESGIREETDIDDADFESDHSGSDT